MTRQDREIIADALASCIKQILHLEGLRAEGKGPIPSTLSPLVVKDADAAIKRLQRTIGANGRTGRLVGATRILQRARKGWAGASQEGFRDD